MLFRPRQRVPHRKKLKKPRVPMLSRPKFLELVEKQSLQLVNLAMWVPTDRH